jgi:malonate decarboxylase alpha subunit
MQGPSRQASRIAKLEQVARRGLASGKHVEASKVVELLTALLQPGDRLCIEGDNQKQASFLADALLQMDPAVVHDLQMALSSLMLPQYLDMVDSGIVTAIDFAYAGPMGGRLADMVVNARIKVNNIHTYVELFSRYFTDLPIDVACITAMKADRAGNLYTGANTEETAAIVEAAAFNQGIVVAQVDEVVDKLSRVDLPADWIDFVVLAPEPYNIAPLFTKDPAKITEQMVLMAMMALKGIYAKYLPTTINHGVGFDSAAIELLLPTYGEELGLKGKACQYWALNPHPTLIPAIEEGYVKHIALIGGEVGMTDYMQARPDVYNLGSDGTPRSNRFYAQMAGHYADIFVGSTLQMDVCGNSSTVTEGRLVGYGGAPNFGCDSTARRHVSPAFLKAGAEAYAGRYTPRGRKLVVQIIETFHGKVQPTFVEQLDAWKMKDQVGLPVPPVMIYGDDVSHVVTEEGIANFLLCRSPEDREQAIRGVAGFTEVGRKRNLAKVKELRDRCVIQYPEDLGIRRSDATRDYLAAADVHDLVRWSKGLYQPPPQFRSW